MDTIELTLAVPEAIQDLLIAELSEAGFEAFTQEDEQLQAYGPAAVWTDSVRNLLNDWLRSREISISPEISYIGAQNWNALWEQSVKPVRAGRFLIKPTWAESTESEDSSSIVLNIDPKMSFGTGHHETTRLVLSTMPSYLMEGSRILDAGTGTGVLAIAAVKLGAKSVIAFDYDPWVEENVAENLRLNGIGNEIIYRTGTLDVVPESDFDVILANINRNVLESYIPVFAERLRKTGTIILSGLLNTDRPGMLELVRSSALEPVAESSEGEWWCVVLQHADDR